MSRFDIVDAQIHLTRELGRDAILHAMDALGITGVVIDEFWGLTPQLRVLPGDLLPSGLSRPLSPTAQAMSIESPQRVSYLQRVERQDPLLAQVMSLLGASAGCRAVRVVLLNAGERSAFSTGGYDQVLSLAVAHDLAVCVLGADLAGLPGLFERHADVRIVLDHCGWARNAGHWQQILDTAALPQVSLKWSHTARAFSKVASPGEDLGSVTAREFLRALDAYGVGRVMWASDVTQENASWHDLLAFVTHHPTLSDGDKQWVLGRAARDVLRWPAPTTATGPAGTDPAGPGPTMTPPIEKDA